MISDLLVPSRYFDIKLGLQPNLRGLDFKCTYTQRLVPLSITVLNIYFTLILMNNLNSKAHSECNLNNAHIRRKNIISHSHAINTQTTLRIFT